MQTSLRPKQLCPKCHFREWYYDTIKKGYLKLTVTVNQPKASGLSHQCTTEIQLPKHYQPSHSSTYICWSAAGCVTEVFSTTCSVHICRGLWGLVVVRGRALVASLLPRLTPQKRGKERAWMFNLATHPWVSFLCTLAEYCSSVYTTSLCPLRAANISGVDPFSSLHSTSTWTDSVFVWMSSGGAAGLSGLSGSVEVSPMGSRLRRPMLSSRRSLESKRLRRDWPLRSCCGRKERGRR